MTAQRTAANLAPGNPVPWRSLEHSAFEDFPEVAMQLRSPHGRARPSRRFIYLAPLALMVAVIYATPVWGLVTVVGPWRFSTSSRTAEGDITVGGVIFAIALASLLVHTAFWLRNGRPSKTALGGNSGMAFILGGLSAAVTVMRGIEESVPDWGLWILPMLACTVVGGIVFFLVGQVRRRSPITIEPLESQSVEIAPEELRAVQQTIDRVPAEDQRLIRDDLAAAIDDLEQRAVITRQDAEYARSAKLGELALQMGQRTSR